MVLCVKVGLVFCGILSLALATRKKTLN
uniref:Uncharacterized protein n=1 Tax=Megaselia scalaris TaxID=36166 RepID=T1GL03_MEGSC